MLAFLPASLSSPLRCVSSLSRRLNFAQCVFHFFGGVLMAWYLLDVWGYNSAWWIWGVFSLIPALMEGTVLIAHYWCNRSPSSGGGSSSSGSWRS